MRPISLAFAFLVAGHAMAQQPADQQKSAAPAEKPVAQSSAAAGGSAAVVYDEAEARRLFRQLDRNGDGFLSSEELARGYGQQNNWAAVDRNGDGRIAPAEFTTLKRP
ncbi:MAG TPA: EF-hand domain-containing protein [Burkholderiales bacterium]|nr:EF-hand domain-containing protein [Burkholderiales bacterium]